MVVIGLGKNLLFKSVLAHCEDKLNDINDTWQEMEGNKDGNKTTRSALSRAVRGVARTTTSAFRQIEEFQLEWQAVDRGKMPTEWKKSKDDPYKRSKQVMEHSTPISALPSRKNSYQANMVKIRPISGPSQVTPPKNQNKNISCSSTTKKDSRIRKKMLTMVTILPLPSKGRSPLKFNARFDTK